jgi:hypothetical protein
VLEDFALLRTLSSEQRLKTFNAMVRQDLVRGEMLVAQGAAPATSSRSPSCAPANWSAKSASSPTFRAPPM